MLLLIQALYRYPLLVLILILSSRPTLQPCLNRHQYPTQPMLIQPPEAIQSRYLIPLLPLTPTPWLTLPPWLTLSPWLTLLQFLNPIHNHSQPLLSVPPLPVLEIPTKLSNNRPRIRNPTSRRRRLTMRNRSSNNNNISMHRVGRVRGHIVREPVIRLPGPRNTNPRKKVTAGTLPITAAGHLAATIMSNNNFLRNLRRLSILIRILRHLRRPRLPQLRRNQNQNPSPNPNHLPRQLRVAQPQWRCPTK